MDAARELGGGRSFTRDSLVLGGGTAAGQVLLLVTSPLVARLFEPGDFADLAVFLAITSMLAVAATGMYELAILLPPDDETADHVRCVTAGVLSLVTLVLLVPTAISVLVGFDPAYSLAVPTMVAASGVTQIQTYWFNRAGGFGRLATVRLLRGVLTVLFLVGFGALGGSGRLLVWAMVGAQVATAILSVALDPARPASLPSRAQAGALLRRYRRFPAYTVPGNLVNAAVAQLPVIIIGARYSDFTLGSYAFTQRVLGAPMGVLGTTVGDVFRARAAQDVRGGRSPAATWRRTFLVLIAIAVPFMVVVALLGREAFELVFGDRWSVAGSFAQILAPLYALALVASTLGRINEVLERQRADLAWQVGLLVVTGASLFIGSTPSRSLAGYTAAYSVMYIGYLAMSWRFARSVPVGVVP